MVNANAKTKKPDAYDSLVAFLYSLPILQSITWCYPSPDNERFFHLLLAAAKDTYVIMQCFDGSHDWSHIQRVMNLASDLYMSERRLDPEQEYNPWVILFAALMHDIDDGKYRAPYAPPNSVHPSNHILIKHGEWLFEKEEKSEFVRAVVTVIHYLSYSYEVKDPHLVGVMSKMHPELAIVQDADRLEALGAVGIGRTFTFGGAKQPDRGMQGTLDHFEEKLFKLEGMMKTESGKALAKVRTARMRVFVDWWMQETAPQRLY